MPERAGTGGVGGPGGVGGVPGGPGGPGGVGGVGGSVGSQGTRGWWERVSPYIVAAGAVAVALMVAYIVVTVHQHNADLNCMKNSFDQLLLELERHHKLTAPPLC